MNPAPTLNPVPMLTAFAYGHADLPDVFRSLVGYDNWLAPIGAAGEYPPRELWLFTDEDAVRRAAVPGTRLGDLACNQRGRDLFSRLDPSWIWVRINPVSPAEQTWNFPAESFPLLQAWCKAIAFEDHLRTLQSSQPSQDRLFAEYPHFTVYLLDDGTILTMPNQANLKNPAVVVTAPDCGRQILKQVPEAIRARLSATDTSGSELVLKLPSQGVDGLLINPAGPGPTYAVHLAPLEPSLAR